MLVFLEFLIAIILGVVFVAVVVAWVKQKHARWRNLAAFTLAAGAAYSASFALDIFIGAVLKVYPLSPFALPVFTWTAIALVLHHFARTISIRPLWVAVPYFGFGAVAVIAGIVGPHEYDIAVGGPLILLGGILAFRRSESNGTDIGPESTSESTNATER